MANESYRCVVLCDPPRGGIVENAINCYQAVAGSLLKALRTLPHVRVQVVNLYAGGLRTPVDRIRALPEQERREFFAPLIDSIPKVDLVLYVDWDRSDVVPLSALKQAAGAERIFSFLEIPIPGMDWCFYLRDSGHVPNGTLIHAPCNKRLYSYQPKRWKVIVDHAWGPETEDWTDLISDWLEPLADGCEIYRLTRFDADELTLKSHERWIPHQSLGNFLTLTEDATAFIVTHRESYGFGVIDMLARAIRVLSPPDFLAPVLMHRFGIPTFTSQSELLDLIRGPFSQHLAINKCTDYADVARMIDERFETL